MVAYRELGNTVILFRAVIFPGRPEVSFGTGCKLVKEVDFQYDLLSSSDGVRKLDGCTLVLLVHTERVQVQLVDLLFNVSRRDACMDRANVHFRHVEDDGRGVFLDIKAAVDEMMSERVKVAINPGATYWMVT